MNEVHQLANALLTVVFATAMFVVGHLFIEKRSTRISAIPVGRADAALSTPRSAIAQICSGTICMPLRHTL
jgi:hypothetical protein